MGSNQSKTNVVEEEKSEKIQDGGKRKTIPKFQHLSNKLKVEREDNRTSSTLTIFCLKNEKYYALSCFHVGYLICREMSKENQGLAIKNEVNVNKKDVQRLMQKNKYTLSDDDSVVGHFSHFSYDPETDIMAIDVGNKKDFQKLHGDEMENVVLDLKNIYKKLNWKGETVKVCTASGVKGEISESHFSIFSEGNLIFRDAIVITIDDASLDSSDAGTLVYFFDEKNNCRPFAYVIFELLRSDDDGKDSDKKRYMCLTLKRALKALNLEDGQFFKLKDLGHKKNTETEVDHVHLTYQRSIEISHYEEQLKTAEKEKDFDKQINALRCLVKLKKKQNPFEMDAFWQKKLDKLESVSRPWKCVDVSTKHLVKFNEMYEYGRKSPSEITLVNDVRVIFSEEFCIGRGSNGTRVYLGLRKDGYGKAVKRLFRDSIDLAQQEKEILNQINAKESNFVVNYSFLEEEVKTGYVYLILDLCEESLQDFVRSDSNDESYLQECLPKILRHILKGLADLHSGSRPILHLDLKPSNVLRDAQGKFLLADFGISRILKNGLKTHVSNANKGTPYWIAPESYCCEDEEIVDKRRYKPESDVMNAGMVAYFVATKGKHPFGTIEYRLHNMLKGKPVGLKEIKDAVLNDLLSWMLQLEPEDRPSANKALKHPYLLSDEEKFDMLCDLGNQPEMKKSQRRNSSTSDVHKQLYGPTEWMKRIDDEVLNDFIKFKVNNKKRTVTYDSSWASCLRFIRNVDQHWHDKPRPRLSQYIQEGNYKEYFLQAFPELPLLVHKVIRSTDWKTRPDLKKHFTKSSSFSYICLEEPRSSSSTFKDEPSTPSGSTGDFKKIWNSITSLSFKSSSKTDEPSTPNTVEFKKRFLTKDHKIKNSVHENLKSFPWLCGKYGSARPTDEMNYYHMYLEVDKSKTENVLKQEIDDKFKWKASDYIELRYVDPRKKIKIQQLSNNVMVSRDDDPNKSHSTLTLFCSKDEQHYALTCAHVGYPKSIPEDQRTFLYIRHQRENGARAVNYLHENKYFYIPKKTTEIALGKLAAYSYNQETDIMAILVDDKATNFTAAEIEVPRSFDDIIGYLSENVGIQKVYKAGRESGENTIFDVNFTFPSNENETPSYRDVVAVKSDHEFLKKGDSGSLIYCYDENMKKIPFAYGVAKVNDGDETYYVCMRLKDGLKNLGLLENVSFKDLSSVKN